MHCCYRFRSKRRKKKNTHTVRALYRRYAKDEQTLVKLAQENGITPRTLQKIFDEHAAVSGECVLPQSNVVVVMDVTGIGQLGGILLCRSNRQNLYWRYVKNECVADYEKAVRILFDIGHTIAGFVVDGKPGVIKKLQETYPDIPCQYCQFHQIKTIKTYIPQRAQSIAARHLRSLALRLTHYHYIQFETALRVWRIIHNDFFTEKTFSIHPQRKRTWRYTHERLRSAYHSLKRNLPYLYTYQKHANLAMPNTTNTCDGFFSHFKERLNRHRGLSIKRKKKMADYLLENW